MVRLVFRPYTQVRRSICTSESLRASTRVSSGFALLRHSSPSFGSQHARSASEPSQQLRSGRRCPTLSEEEGPNLSLSLRARVFHPNTREHVRLLGPCFKTGRLKPLSQHPKRVTWANPGPSWKGRAASLDPVRRVSYRRAITHPEVPRSRRLPTTVEIDAGPSGRGKYVTLLAEPD
jgi:hypothetical protein